MLFCSVSPLGCVDDCAAMNYLHATNLFATRKHNRLQLGKIIGAQKCNFEQICKSINRVRLMGSDKKDRRESRKEWREGHRRKSNARQSGRLRKECGQALPCT